MIDSEQKVNQCTEPFVHVCTCVSGNEMNFEPGHTPTSWPCLTAAARTTYVQGWRDVLAPLKCQIYWTIDRNDKNSPGSDVNTSRVFTRLRLGQNCSAVCKTRVAIEMHC